jgi:hypothetical protein
MDRSLSYNRSKPYTLHDLVGNPNHESEARNELYKGLSTGMDQLDDPDNWNGGISLFVTPMAAVSIAIPCLLVAITNICKGIFWSLAFLLSPFGRETIKESLSEKFSYLKQDGLLLSYCLVCAIPIIGAFLAWGNRVDHMSDYKSERSRSAWQAALAAQNSRDNRTERPCK